MLLDPGPQEVQQGAQAAEGRSSPNLSCFSAHQMTIEVYLFERNRKTPLKSLRNSLKYPVSLKVTASAVPNVLTMQCGFSRWGTFPSHAATFSTSS